VVVPFFSYQNPSTVVIILKLTFMLPRLARAATCGNSDGIDAIGPVIAVLSSPRQPAAHRGVLTVGGSCWEGQVRDGLSGTRHKSRLPGATNSFNNDSHPVCDKIILNLIAIDQRLSGPRKGS